MTTVQYFGTNSVNVSWSTNGAWALQSGVHLLPAGPLEIWFGDSNSPAWSMSVSEDSLRRAVVRCDDQKAEMEVQFLPETHFFMAWSLLLPAFIVAWVRKIWMGGLGE